MAISIINIAPRIKNAHSIADQEKISKVALSVRILLHPPNPPSKKVIPNSVFLIAAFWPETSAVSKNTAGGIVINITPLEIMMFKG